MINSSTKCLISVKIAVLILPSHIHHHHHWWMFGWYTIFRDMKLKLFTFLKISIGLSYGGLLHAQTPEHEVSNMSNWHWRGIHAVARPTAPPICQKVHLFSHKMGHKWGVCVRVGGEVQKVHFLGPKGPHFEGSAPQSILATGMAVAMKRDAVSCLVRLPVIEPNFLEGKNCYYQLYVSFTLIKCTF